MACPRCGCRMISKGSPLSGAGRGQLVCCDCGQVLRSTPALGPRLSRRSQLMTVGLLALFGLTAGGLMTFVDQHSSSLNQEQPLNLGQRRQLGNDQAHRWNSVLPRTSSLRN